MSRIVTLALATGIAFAVATSAQAGGFGGASRGAAAGFATGSAVFNKVQILRGHTSGATGGNDFQMSVYDDVGTQSTSVRVKGGYSNTSILRGTIILTGRNGAFEGYIGGKATVGSSSSVGNVPRK